jgi:hypothetical protein
MAEEGSFGEMGLRPLSNAFPFSNRIEIEVKKKISLRRG